ncbi:MAG: acyl-CoA dehydrogenase family protein [Anaerovoracaceae bacterium]|jgi:butyryl-CoA dehydrogenase
MNFQLTKEQELTKKMVEQFCEDVVGPTAEELDKSHEWPEDIVRQMGELGMMGIIWPKEYGGAGGDYISYCEVIERITATHAAVGTVIAAHTSLCTGPIYYFGTEEQRQKYVTQLATGKKLGAFGLTEADAGSDSGATQTRAEDCGDYWLINGSKIFITNGGHADIFVITAVTDKKKKTHGGISAFIIERGDEGFSTGKEEDKLGIHCSSTVELIFQDCKIPKDRIIGNVGDGFKIAMQTLEKARIGVAAQGLGVAQGAFEITKEYMNQRKQFGKKLTKFQYPAFTMAELYTRIQAARLLIFHAADLADKGQPCGLESSMAKFYASEIAMDMATKGVQFHGGYGYINDYEIQRYFRDAKIMEIYEGTSEIQKLIVSGAILK